MSAWDTVARRPTGATSIAKPAAGDGRLSGRGSPYAAVEVYKNTDPTPVAVALVDALGSWAVDLPVPIIGTDIYRTADGGVAAFEPLVMNRPFMTAPVVVTIPMTRNFSNEAAPIPEDQDVIYRMADPTQPMKFAVNVFGGRNVIIEGVHVLDCVTFFEFTGAAYLGSSCIDVETAGTWSSPFTPRITDCVRFRGKRHSSGELRNRTIVENCWLGGLHGGSVRGHADCVQHLDKSDVARFTGRNLTCVSNYQIFIFQNNPANLVTSSATRFLELKNINTYHNRIPGDPGDTDTTAIFMGSGLHPGIIEEVYIDWWKMSTNSDFSLPFVINPTVNWVDSLGYNGSNGKTRLAGIPGPTGATGVNVKTLSWPPEMGLIGQFKKGQPPGGDFCPKARVSLLPLAA